MKEDQARSSVLALGYFGRLVDFVGPRMDLRVTLAGVDEADGRWRLHAEFAEGTVYIYAGPRDGPGQRGRYFAFCFGGAEPVLSAQAERLTRGLSRAPLRPPSGMVFTAVEALEEACEAVDVSLRRARVLLSAHCDRACVFCNTNYRRMRDPSLAPWTVRLAESAGRRFLEVEAEENEELLRNLPRWYADGVRSLDWSGPDVLNSRYFDDVLREAYALGFREMRVTTPGSRLADAGFVSFLAAHGVRAVALTWHGSTPEDWALTNGCSTALEVVEAAYANVRRAGLDVYLNVPCVLTNHQSVPAVAERFAREGLAGLSIFYWHPEETYPDAYAYLPFSVEDAKSVWIEVAKRAPAGTVQVTGVPACGIPEGLEEHLEWDAQLNHLRAHERVHGEACAGCVGRELCGGLPRAYWSTHAVVPITSVEDSRLRWLQEQTQKQRQERPRRARL